MNQVTILFFASLRERAGVRQAVLDLPDGARVSDLKMVVSSQFPGVNAALPTTVVSINHEFAEDEDYVPAAAEVALFPPVSGGNSPTYLSITEEELDLNRLLTQITLPTTGAACIFTGMVRGETRRGNSHLTSYLEYESYVPMAEAKMRQVAEEIRACWPEIEGISIVQRIGRLEPGTPTVIIACTAAHRDTGVFEAARYGIDRLKEIVPIWKKEVSPTGEAWVEGDYIPGIRDHQP